MYIYFTKNTTLIFQEFFHLGGQTFHHDYIRWGWLTLIISFQSKGMWSFDSIETSSTGILDCANTSY